MPVSKTYLRYAPSGILGLINSSANCVFLSDGIVACAALERIVAWDVRRDTEAYFLKGGTAEITRLDVIQQQGGTGTLLAAGDAEGAIRLWRLPSTEADINFSGHRGHITSLGFSADGARLASGSRDTDIIVWDVINECGLFRLRGHKGPVNAVRLLTTSNRLISASKDSFVKVWDLDTQHCVHTIVGHRTEVCALDMSADETLLVTGAADNLLRVWSLGEATTTASTTATATTRTSTDELAAGDDYESNRTSTTSSSTAADLSSELVGTLRRQSRERALTVRFSPDYRLLLCQGADKMIETFRVNSAEETKRKLARRFKRVREKARKAALAAGASEIEADAAAATAAEESEASAVPSLDDRIEANIVLRTPGGKVRSFDVRAGREAGEYEVLVGLANNSLEQHRLMVKRRMRDSTSSRVIALSRQGHRSPVRALAMTSDGTLLLSTSNHGAKLWNTASGRCLRSLDADYGLCAAFAPGNRHVLIGTRAGQVQLFELGSGAMLENIEAHTKAIWSLALAPDKQGFVTGSADNEVKFWEFELVAATDKSSGGGRGGSAGKRLSCVHTRTLKMTDEVTCVCYSPNQNLLAVALLDSTVKVFYADTLKFFLSLYGHKLPVVCMDISADSTLLISGSADKNVKVWGLDFGDCHKSFFAHQDTVTNVRFIGTTHYFFSVSKDRTVKEWNADNFEQIMTLEGHHDSIGCATISDDGKLLATGSHDRSVRLWQRTREMLNPDEEREMEREAAYDKEQAEQESREARAAAGSAEAGRAGKKSTETVLAAERIMEALEVADADAGRMPATAPNPIISAYNCANGSEYLRHVVASVRAAELDEALLVLPFSFVLRLVPYLRSWVDGDLLLERSCRCIFFLLRAHHNLVTTNAGVIPGLPMLAATVQARLQTAKDVVGFNLAGLRYLEDRLAEEGVRTFEDATKSPAAKAGKKRKRKRTVV